MEVKQRSVVTYLHRKGMKLPAIVAERAAVYHEDAFDEIIVNIGYMRVSYIVPI
jgi:hypothetical protein